MKKSKKVSRFLQGSVVALLVIVLIVYVYTQNDSQTVSADEESCCDFEFITDVWNNSIDSMLEGTPFGESRKAEISDELKRNSRNWRENSVTRLTEDLITIQDLAPELAGLSSNWQTTEDPKLFSDIISGFGSYHKFSDQSRLKLTSSIENLVNIVPEEQQSSLHAEMNVLTKYMASALKSTHNRHLESDQLRADLIEFKEAIFEEGFSIDTDFVENYSSCVMDLRASIDKDMRKTLSSFSSSFEDVAISIKKMDESDQDFSREISGAVTGTFINGVLLGLLDAQTSQQQGYADCRREVGMEGIIEKLTEVSVND